jgi:N-acetylneuraminic acid mutarotase
MIICSSCTTDDAGIPANTTPVITTTTVSGITNAAVVTGGFVTNIGGTEVTAHGVCWSTAPNPTLTDNKTTEDQIFSSSAFSSSLTGLMPNTTYYVRAYVTNSAGTVYGNQIIFATSSDQGPSTKIADLPGMSRYGAASFSVGTKEYVGIGFNDGDWPMRDFWEWDQTTNVWTRKADFPGKIEGNAVSFSIGTKGYIGTGDDFNTNGYTNEFWEYDPATNSWTQKASLPGTFGRGLATGFSIGTKGYIGLGGKDLFTGVGLPKYYQDFWEWDQATNVWTKKADFGGIARNGAVGFSIGNKGYIGTGCGEGNSLLKDFWEWDQATNVWTKKADFGGIARSGAVGFSIGNKGFIGTGNDDGNNLFKDLWEWDQATNVWMKKADFGGMARNTAVGFSIGNKGYIGTGCTGINPNYAFQDFWEVTLE